MLLEQGVVRGAAYDEDPPLVRENAELSEGLRARVVGDDQLDIGVRDIAGEFRALTRRVDADERRATERCSREPEEIFGLVLQQHADMERAVDAQARR